MVIGQRRAVVKVQYALWKYATKEGVKREYTFSHLEKFPRVRAHTSGSCDFLLSQPSQKQSRDAIR